ncbi:MAG TPA: prepilin-type N-terminal cleavage/methylation domain-containing protein, partial [Armatimonadetes bacterium]|nr:prepilin-type N-terminal cleavage/methylation domain-containing protein [Armatimonadota bacterium]
MIGKFVKCNTSGNFGMTLIEMLVAMTIAVILLGGLYGVFRVAHLTVQTADEQVTINQIARVVLDRMTRELRSCYPMWVPVPEDVMQQGAMMGISAQMPTEMPSQVLTFFPEDNYDEQTELDQDSLRFTAAVNDPRGYDEPAYDLAEIAYYIDVDDETPEEGLVRAVGLLPGLVSEEATEEQRKVTVLSDRVWALNFRFYDDETDEWLDTWENLEMLPSA